MPNISIDVDSLNEAIILKGDLQALKQHRFAFRYLKDFFRTEILSDSIRIPWEDDDANILLSKITNMLGKYGFAEIHTPTTDKVLLDFREEEEKFADFSLKAFNIRNNNCNASDFAEFVRSLELHLTNRSLYQLQLLSAYHLAFAQNACNFSVPGAGKTSIVYAAYAYLRNLPKDDIRSVDRILIVGPLSSFGPWEMEYSECFGCRPSVKRLIGTQSKEEKQTYLYSQYPSELTLISYASLCSLKDEIIHFLKSNRVMVVLDEAHKAKNTSGGLIAQTILDIAKFCKSRVVLTGTPAPNGYEDLYNMFKFIWPLKNVIGFEVNQLRDLTAVQNKERIASLVNNIAPFFIRIRKSDLAIPQPTVYPPIEVEMGEVQRKIYDFIERKYVESLIAERQNPSSYLQGIFAKAKTLRLMQAATNPSMLKKPLSLSLLDEDGLPDYVDATQIVDDTQILSEILQYEKAEIPTKYLAVKDLVQKIIASGGKVVIWGIFIHTICDLHDYLQKHGIASRMLYGDVPVEQDSMSEESDILTRERIIREFHAENSPFKVIIANPFAVAESISLHKCCHHAIYLERSFNAAHFVQSKDRIHRYGLKLSDEVCYYYILAKNSIDETIHSRLHEKESRMNAIMESMPIPLFDNATLEFGDEDIKALIHDYVRRTKKNF